MSRQASPALILLLLVGTLAPAQQQTPEPPVIRVDVNLIQIDVTVTDRQGSRIPDLTPDDFEVLLDGRRQPIQSVLWVGRRPAPAPAAAGTASPIATTAVPRQLTRQQVRRTVAILVDDLSLSAESLRYTREAIRKFIEANVAEGDLIALFRTSSGMSFLQQFTADRRQLFASLERIRLGDRRQVNPLAPVLDNPAEASGDPILAEIARNARLRDEIERRRDQDMITAGMLGSLRYLTLGLRDLPGRKSMILFSESIQLFDLPQSLFNDMSRASQLNPGSQGGPRERTVAALRSLTDLANRSGVTFYAIDPRGAQPLGLTVQDSPATSRRGMSAANQRTFEFTASQDGLQAIAEDTGGVFFKGTNDITAALRDAVAEQEEYYLIGITPDEKVFEKARSEGELKLRRIEIKVKKPGLRARHRKGFLGQPDAADPALAEAKQNPLIAAMLSPFRATDVPVRMTPLFTKARAAATAVTPEPGKKDKKNKKEQDARAAVRVMVHVDASKLAFTDAPADSGDKDRTPWKTASVEFAVCLFDHENRIVAKAAQQQSFRARGAAFEGLRRDGVVEQLIIGLPQSGPWHLRAAILDKASGLAGSAAQFLEIPDLNKGLLESSDLVINVDGWQTGLGERGSPARRVFAPGQKLNYLMMVYNAKTSAQTKSSQLETQIVLYKDGKQVLASPRSPLEVADDPNDKDVTLSGSFQIGSSMQPGEYTIEITVRDPLAPKKQQYTIRSMNFEIRAI